MRKSKILIVLAASSFFAQAVGAETARDLPFFNGERAAVQQGAVIVDMTGKSAEEIGRYMATAVLDFESITQEALDLAERAVENNKKIAPVYMEIMGEQAKARGVSLVEMLAVGQVMDLKINKSLAGPKLTAPPKGCTTVAFETGLVGQTFDYPISFLNDHTTVLKTEDRMQMFADGMLLPGMGRRVGITVNYLGLYAGEGAQYEDNVVTLDAVTSGATQKNSVQEVIDMLQNYRTPIPYNFTVADADGDYASIEVTRDAIKVSRGERGVAHANHTDNFRDEVLSEMSFSEANQRLFYTFVREDYANLFVSYTPELTIEAMQYLFEQRPVNMTVYKGGDFITVESYVWDLKNGCAYVSGDNPRFGKYTKECF